MPSKRIEWVDIAKGIAIVAMIIGHEIPNNDLRTFIFSFHMPLFFILSGYTSRQLVDYRTFGRKTWRGFIHIWLLAVAMIALLIIETMIYNHGWNIRTFFYDLFAAVYHGSNTLNYKVTLPTNNVGVMWFMFVFFWAKTLYDFCQIVFGNKYGGIILGILAFFGYVVSQRVWLPQALDIVPIASLFMWTGYYIRVLTNNRKDNDLISQVALISLFIFWIYCLQNSINIEMSTRSYPKFVISLCEAVAGTSIICYLSNGLSSLSFSKPFKLFGQHTLALLCIHHLDLYWVCWGGYISSWELASISRLVVDCILLFIYLYLISLKRRIKGVS